MLGLRTLSATLVPLIACLVEFRRTTHCSENAPEVLPGAVKCVVTGDEDLKGGPTVVHIDRPYQDRFMPFLIHLWSLLYDRDWKKECRIFMKYPDFAFLDVGANYGAFTLPLAQCQGVWRVVAVEPSPIHVALLEASLRANHADHVVLYPFAVSNASGGTLNFTAERGNQGHISAVETSPEGGVGETFAAPVTTLDDIYREMPEVMGRVLVMKMDIEGAEGWALQGARRFLSEAPPCFCKVEFFEPLLEQAGTPPADVVAYMASLGYVVSSRSRMFLGVPPDVHFEQENITACVLAKSRRLKG